MTVTNNTQKDAPMPNTIYVTATRPNGFPQDGDYHVQDLNFDAVAGAEYDADSDTTLVTLTSGQQISVKGSLAA